MLEKQLILSVMVKRSRDGRADEGGMSMLIRSQNKESIINMDIVTDISFTKDPFKVIASFTHSQSMVLGTYFSKKKAIKVLDIIQEEYLKCNREHLLGNYAFVQNRVFQMPQDSEV